MEKIWLYSATIVIELIFGLVRVLFFTLFFGVLIAGAFLLVGGGSGDAVQGDAILFSAVTFAFLTAYANVILSLLAFFGFGGGGWFTRRVFGARRPSRREFDAVTATLQQIVEGVDFSVPGFTRFWVMDSPMESVNLVGTYLYISSAAIKSGNLPILIGHELGRANDGDGGLVLALRRLVFPVFYMFISGVRSFSPHQSYTDPRARGIEDAPSLFSMLEGMTFFSLATFGGGVGVWIMSGEWTNYFQKQDYRADAYTARLGYKENLLQYLEGNLFYDTAVPYMPAWVPVNELRIDVLQHGPHGTDMFIRDSGWGDTSESGVARVFGLFDGIVGVFRNFKRELRNGISSFKEGVREGKGESTSSASSSSHSPYTRQYRGGDSGDSLKQRERTAEATATRKADVMDSEAARSPKDMLFKKYPRLQESFMTVEAGTAILVAKNGDANTVDMVATSAQTLLKLLSTAYREGNLSLLQGNRDILKTLGLGVVSFKRVGERAPDSRIPLTEVVPDVYDFLARYDTWDTEHDLPACSLLALRYSHGLMWRVHNEDSPLSERQCSFYGGLLVLEEAWKNS